jgi:hypothetical protein
MMTSPKISCLRPRWGASRLSDANTAAQGFLHSRFTSLRARCANAKNVDDVVGVGEPVGRGDRLCPLFYGVCFNLNGFSARAADQVVVVASRTARAIKVFAIGRGENIGPVVIDK